MSLFDTNYFSEFSYSICNLLTYFVTYSVLFLLVSLFLFFNYKLKNTQKFLGVFSLVLLSGFPPSPLFFIKIYALYLIYLKFSIFVFFSFLVLVVLFWYVSFLTISAILANYESVQYLLSLFTRRFRIVYIVHYFSITLLFIYLGLWVFLTT